MGLHAHVSDLVPPTTFVFLSNSLNLTCRIIMIVADYSLSHMRHDFFFPSLTRGRIKFSTPLNLSVSWDCIKQQKTVAGGKEPVCQCMRPKRHRVDPWVGKFPWRRARQPTPVPGESDRQRSLGPTVHGVAKSQTRLSDSHTHTHTHPMYKSAGFPFLFVFSNFSEHRAFPL